MTLLDLVKKYKGDCKFDVNGIVDDNNQDLVVFMNSEHSAIKDEIMESDVIKFTAVFGARDSIPTINVLVKPKKKEEAENSSQQTPSQSENQTENTTE